MDDQWLTTSDPLQFSTDQFPPRNLQLRSLGDGLFASWDTPLQESGEVVAGYDITCTPTESSHLYYSLTVDGSNINSVMVDVIALQPTDYSCCVTSRIQRDMLTLISPEVCDTVQFTPEGSQGSNSILVPVLGVLVGVFFLALLVMGVALVVFMTTSTSKMKRLEDRDNLEESKE